MRSPETAARCPPGNPAQLWEGHSWEPRSKDILTTWGAEPFQKRVAERDATVGGRLRNAGAVLMAKLSMGALAQGGLWFKGMTKTPWNTERS